MKLNIIRNTFTNLSVMGELYINNVFECFTMENASAIIPLGLFEVIINFSDKFQRRMPLIIVPGREGIRFHIGNKPWDFTGCVGVGKERDDNWVGKSKLAFDTLFLKLDSILEKEKVFLEITSVTPEKKMRDYLDLTPKEFKAMLEKA